MAQSDDSIDLGVGRKSSLLPCRAHSKGITLASEAPKDQTVRGDSEIDAAARADGLSSLACAME
jgi:hypothetical protein